MGYLIMKEFNCTLCGEDKKEKSPTSHPEVGYICDECEWSLPDPTGFCSLECRLGGECDDSC